MQRFIIGLTVLLLAAPFLSLLLRESSELRAEPVRPPAALLDPAAAPMPEAVAERSEPEYRNPAEDSIFREAAELAWRYVDSQYQPATGLVNSVVSYPYATIWDMASTLAAYYSANRLGLLADAEYDQRVERALGTLADLPLFAGGAFNKNYQIARGVPAGRSDREISQGYGWSATDLGRLLVWLRIVAAGDPEHADDARAVVDRLAFERLVRDGYLWGEDLDRAGRRRAYPEGGIGYEQYAAAGFALWEQFADNALSIRENSEQIEVLGVPVPSDERPGAYLTSEPFVLMGMEVGWWSPYWRQAAEQVLAAQRARYEQTGQVTIVSEDAVPVPPYFFYYYTVHGRGDDFAVVTLTSPRGLPGPRWISTKGAFAWYALDPGPYTWRALQAVLPAANSGVGWSSGIYEQSGRPTGGQNINTSAVILEAALYHRLRRPILAAAQDEGDAGAAERPDSSI